MKVFVVLLAVVGIACGASVSVKETSTLNDDFNAIISTIPIKNVTSLVLTYISNDKEAQEFIAYMTGDKFAVIWKAIFSATEVKEMMAWAFQKGVPIYEKINQFADLLGMAHVQPREAVSTRGVATFLEELFKMVDPQQLIANIKKQVAISADFNDFYTRLSSDRFHKFVHRIYMMSELQDELTVLKSQHVEVEKIVNDIANVLGWKEI